MANLIIIGGGPAGLSASIYAARAGLKPTVLYQGGGALEKTDKIENYFGFAQPVTGAHLLGEGRAQAERLGVTLTETEVTGAEYAEKGFVVKTTGQPYEADAIILATGAPRSAPKIPGIAELEGRGVSYCAICDAFFYRGKSVAVLGQGEYAVEEAKTLLPVVSSVTLLTNGAEPPAGLPDGISVETRPVARVAGEDKVSAIAFQDGAALAADGLFIAYGTAGSTDFARKLGAMTEGRSITVDGKMMTNVPGLFAAGDCTGGLLQVAKAVSDGAIAAMSAIKYLRG